MRQNLLRAAVLLAALAVAAGLRPDTAGWRAVAASAFDDAQPPSLDDVAVLVAGTALWCLAAWVVVALGAAGLAQLPGAAGAAGRLVVLAFVPRFLRGVVLGGVAGGLLLGPAVAADAVPVWPTSPPASASPEPGPVWPSAPPTAAPVDTPRPVDTPAPTSSGATSVVVAPGDSLWSITADALRDDGIAPTDAQVAAAWPTWFAVNRAAIGDDPGLLRPGTHLSAPTVDGSTS